MVPVSSAADALFLDKKALGSPVTYTERKDATNPIDVTPTFLSVLYGEEAKAKHR